MVVVTGGAGLIGSILVGQLNALGEENIIIVDHLGQSDKWKKLVPLRYSDYLDRTQFIDRLEAGQLDGIDTIFHFGACSEMTNQDASYLMENNYQYTLRIAQWCAKNGNCKLIYASSAATYGLGENGFSDAEEILETLKPLNMYAYSKHLFDLKAKREGWFKSIVGLKLFNVYGSDDTHKGSMHSFINMASPIINTSGKISLFKSCNPSYADGESMRDFIYVEDVAKLAIFFWQNRDICGLFNGGTGEAHSWKSVMNMIFDEVGVPSEINYIEMPNKIKNSFQYYTSADLSKLRSVGCDITFKTVEQGIKDHIRKLTN